MDQINMDIQDAAQEAFPETENMLRQQLRVQGEKRRENAQREVQGVLDKYRVQFIALGISPDGQAAVPLGQIIHPGWNVQIVFGLKD